MVDGDRNAILKAIRQVRLARDTQSRTDAQELVHRMYDRLRAKLEKLAKYYQTTGLVEPKVMQTASLTEQAQFRQAAALEKQAQVAQLALNLKLRKVRVLSFRCLCDY